MDAFRHNLFLRSPVRAVQRPIAVHVNAITAIIAITTVRLIAARLGANVRWGERCRTKARHACAANCKVTPIDAETTQCYSHHDKSTRSVSISFYFHSNVIILCLASGLIEISTVDRGVVSLYGVKSELFVAMNSRGRLYGTVGMHSISFIVQQCWLLGAWK